MMGAAQSGGDLSPVLNGLEALLRETDFAWSLDLIGEDQAGKLATLTGDIRRGVSTTGDGKRITSVFSYLGTEPGDRMGKCLPGPPLPGDEAEHRFFRSALAQHPRNPGWETLPLR